MSLRRFAQENYAGVTGSPRSSAPQSSNSSPKSPLVNPPSTPRNRPSIGLYRSPASTPSISSSIPFDWEAARSRRPPPYSTPQNKIRKSVGVSNGNGTSARKAVIRKKSLYEKSVSVSSRKIRICLLLPVTELSQFRLLSHSRSHSSPTTSPSHLPKPRPKYSAAQCISFTSVHA